MPPYPYIIWYFEGFQSDCHREIQRRDQRLRSIQKTIFGVLCLLIGIAAYYFTFYHTETGPLIKNHQPGQDSEAKVSTELCPSSSDLNAEVNRQNIENYQNDNNMKIIKFDKS